MDESTAGMVWTVSMRDNGSYMLQSGEVRNLRAASGLHSYRSLSLTLRYNLCLLVSMVLHIFLLVYSWSPPSLPSLPLFSRIASHLIFPIPACPSHLSRRPSIAYKRLQAIKSHLCLLLTMSCITLWK